MKLMNALMMATLACSSIDKPTVYRLGTHGKSPIALEFNSLVGVRDGYRVQAILMFADSLSDVLSIRFELEPGVPTKFVSGEYTWKEQRGVVRASWVDFFGGQGDVPSIGGVFVFTLPDGTEYRIELPPTELKRR